MINRAVVKMDDKRPCIAQFLINHFSKDEREFLMKKEIREEVCKLAGSYFSISILAWLLMH